MHMLRALMMIQLVTSTTVTLPKQDILHKTSGLMLNYISEYKPANNIISFMVSIPMYNDTCYLIPLNAMKKIPQCNIKSMLDDTNYENRSKLLNKYKRFISSIISIATGTAPVILSTVNTIQNANLQREIKTHATSIYAMRNSIDMQSTQILRLSNGQIQLVEELQNTQIALNNTIALVNEHSNILKQHRGAINTLSSMLMFLTNKLTSFNNSVKTHFIHTSIEDILSNKLNLRFIHHDDLPRVIDIITKEINIFIDHSDSSLPTIEIINRLLVQQHVEFIPINKFQKNDEGIIGNLLFTSFFACSNKNQHSFSTYQLTPIPFNQGNQRVRLAQLPSFIAISSTTSELIQWTKDESKMCEFRLSSSCRETPPIRKNWQKTCLFEILTDSKLTLCRIESELEPIFVMRIGKYWAISTKNATKCHPVTEMEREQHTLTTNNEIILPPIVLLTLDNSTSLSCNHFFLPALAVTTNISISMIENRTISNVESNLINLYDTINNDTQWEKIPFISSNMQNIIDYLAKTSSTPLTLTSMSWFKQSMQKAIIILIVIIIILIILHMYVICNRKKKKTTKMIIMASM